MTIDFSDLPIPFLVGIFLLIGWGGHSIGKYFQIPRVTLLLVAGLLCGPFVFDIFPHNIAQWFPDIAHMALAMVGFLLGSNFVGHDFKKRGRAIIYISLGKTIFSVLLVFVSVLVVTKKHIAYCLFPQVGVALGLALLTTEHFPELGKSILSLIVGTTIIFELFGPIVTKWQLHKAGES